MENASKALIMAGGILIALLIIALLIRGFANISSFQQTMLSQEEKEELIAFNEQYTKYLNQHVYGTDIISVINKSLNNTTHKITVSIKFISYYKYNGYEEYWVNGKKRWREKEFVIDKREKVVIENDEVLDQNMTSFINSLEDTDLNTMAFKCTNIGYGSNGRVNSISFEEKEWNDLW